jgi:hypothetical protein
MKASIDRLIAKYGEPVQFTPRGGTTTSMSAVVQLPMSDALVNDFDVTGFVVYMRTQDVPQAPTKFDRVTIRGEDRGIEEVQVETLSGETICYVLRVRG